MLTVAQDEVVVTGVGLVSPRRTPAGVLDPAPTEADAEWFDARAELGPRGHKYLPPGARYLLAAGRRALRAAGPADGVPPELRGLVLGTNSALAPLFRDMDRTVIESGAERLSPATAPYFAINVLASRLASEEMFKGFSLTLTSPAVAGLEAVEVATRALRLGRARTVLVTAAEDRVPPGEPGAGSGEEGAVGLVLEPRAHAERRGAHIQGVCRVRSAFVPPAGGRDAPGGELSRRVADLVHALCPEWERHPLPVYAVLDGSARGRAVARELASLTAGARPLHERTAGAGCLAPLLHAAALLSTGAEDCVVVTATATGQLAAARVGGAATHHHPAGGIDAEVSA
ncbi:3-oxoacyl-ACP synthase [Streptomyces sp. NBC_00250]|uniref:beta-ketoacyl synthase N-terminal-like domain-containing protein n=1 Tax=Streptomyces sp. NBC_00250 TaxID=2903641 RepID=UPI002E2E3311|nr:beta-ketoacyl synthase N-terminal-like domain-containing protein [Streptomyces sp. NBC_00250]